MTTMTRRNPIVHARSVAAAALLLAVAAGGYHFGLATLVPRDQTPFLFESAFVEFGPASAVDELPVVLSLRNPASSQIQVLGIDASCSCASIQPAVLVIDPGKRRDVLALLDLLRAYPAGQPPGTHNIVVELLAQYEQNGRFAAERCVVSGRVYFPVAPPAPLCFVGADCVFGSRGAPTKSVLVSAASNVAALTATCAFGEATTEVRRLHGGSGPAFNVEVTPSARTPAGEFAFAVELTAYATDGRALSGVPLRVHGMALADILVTPDIVLLGADEGATAETLTVQSLSGAEFSVDSVQVAGEAADAVRCVPTADDRVYSLRAAAVQRGTARAEVLFKVRSEDGSESEVKVPVVIHGGPVTQAMNAPSSAAVNNE